MVLLEGPAGWMGLACGAAWDAYRFRPCPCFLEPLFGSVRYPGGGHARGNAVSFSERKLSAGMSASGPAIDDGAQCKNVPEFATTYNEIVEGTGRKFVLARWAC